MGTLCTGTNLHMNSAGDPIVDSKVLNSAARLRAVAQELEDVAFELAGETKAKDVSKIIEMSVKTAVIAALLEKRFLLTDLN